MMLCQIISLFLTSPLFPSLSFLYRYSVKVHGASCAMCHNAVVSHSRGLIAIEDARRRCRLSHRVPVHLESRWIRSFLSLSCREALKKAGHRFWPMSLLVSLRISRSLPLPSPLPPPLSLSWSQTHTVPHITDKVKVVSLRSSTSSSANLLRV